MLALFLTYRLSEPFSPESNLTGILLKGNQSKAIGGNRNGISTEPNQYDRGMLANDNKFFLYGGAMLSNIPMFVSPAADVLGFQVYSYGVEKSLWGSGFRKFHLNGGVSIHRLRRRCQRAYGEQCMVLFGPDGARPRAYLHQPGQYFRKGRKHLEYPHQPGHGYAE